MTILKYNLTKKYIEIKMHFIKEINKYIHDFSEFQDNVNFL